MNFSKICKTLESAGFERRNTYEYVSKDMTIENGESILRVLMDNTDDCYSQYDISISEFGFVKMKSFDIGITISFDDESAFEKARDLGYESDRSRIYINRALSQDENERLTTDNEQIFIKGEKNNE